ncbi:MAG: MFS transporter [Microcella pacifica]|uniref:MFS transporter n=1 Tax=Microcella pacifica TaxID=2591847 RepID=UPI00331530E4
MPASTSAGFPPTEPIVVHRGRIPLRDSFASLSIRNYRRFQASQVIAHTSGWMQRIATDWLVFELTGNIAAVGLTVLFQWGPMILFGAWGGVLADRFPKRPLLMVIYGGFGALSALLSALALLGWAELWHVYLIAFVLGLAFVLEAPARVVLVSEMVDAHRLRNAISLGATVFHFGGFVGPALAGVVIALAGSGWAIAANALGMLMVVVTLTTLRRNELSPVPRSPHARGQLRAALRYIRRKPTILWPMVLAAFISTFGMPLPVLLTGMADRVFATGATGYGLYTSVVAIGALSGALLSTRVRTLRLRTIFGAAVVFGIVQALAGLAPSTALFLPLLVGIGIARLVQAILADSLVQLSSNRSIRGRIMSLYVVVVIGGQALGGPLMGAVAELIGPRLAMVAAGGIPALAAMVIALIIARRGNLRLQLSLRRHQSIVSIVSRSTVSPPQR